MNLIDMTTVREILAECTEIAEELDGAELDESASLDDRSRSRKERAELSRTLTLLANRAELIAALARNEYWTARGLTDHLHPLTKNARD